MSAEPSHTILCGTDFTETSRDAVDLAALLAGAFRARLEVVHVLDVSCLAAGDADAHVRAAARVSERLSQEVSRLAASHAVAIGSRIVTGSPALRIAELARELEATLIVVAAIGPTPSIFRVGGTAERVAQAARVPVLLVRGSAPLRAWLAGDSLAVAGLVGEDAASDHVIEWLRALRRIGACDVAVLQAYYTDEAARRFGLAPRSMVDHDPEIDGYLRRDLERRVGDLGGRGRLDIHPVRALGRHADHLLEHPAGRKAGLVVVGNHRTRGVARLSSVASGVVHLAESSVLVVPVEAASIAPGPWPELRRVLVATDFSSFAAEAIRSAYGLVAPTRGEVVLLHVLTEPGITMTLAECTTELRRLIPVRPPDGVTTRVDAIWDADAAAGIVQAAARFGADCIVIASHGRSGLRKVFLGSVAQGVVQRSHRPVMIVRPGEDA